MKVHSAQVRSTIENTDEDRLQSNDTPACLHADMALTFWSDIVGKVITNGGSTPFYVFSAGPVAEALTSLKAIEKVVPVPIRHWFPMKTQPLSPLLEWWHAQGRPVEVASEFELKAAIKTGFSPDRILLNGPAKNRLAPHLYLPGLRVNIDSSRELTDLAGLARKFNWSLGVRCLTSQETDPENPRYPTQFGLEPTEAVHVIRKLKAQRLKLETIHFHLRTNVQSAEMYGRAIRDVAEICAAARFHPRFLDIGGGLPAPRVMDRTGKPLNAQMDLLALGKVLSNVVREFPGLEEIWMENGRFLLAGSGALVTRVLDKKFRHGLQQLICDGGRTLHAIPSIWERHHVFPLSRRRAASVPTIVYGPTCMAFDQLGLFRLPRTVDAGDILVWLDAGAYHLQWETHFSHGPAEIWWHNGQSLHRVRQHGDFDSWWKNLGG